MADFNLEAGWGGTQSGTTNTSLALSAAGVIVGQFVVIGVYIRGASSATGVAMASSLGNTYSQIAGLNGGTTTRGEIWGGFVTQTGTETITVSWTNAGAASAAARAISGISGTTTANAQDAAAVSAQAANNAPATGNTGATSVIGDLLIGFVGQNALGTFSAQAFNPAALAVQVPDGTFQTTGTDNSTCQLSLGKTTGTGVQSFSLSSSGSGQWVALIATFKPLVATKLTANLRQDYDGNAWTVQPMKDVFRETQAGLTGVTSDSYERYVRDRNGGPL